MEKGAPAGSGGWARLGWDGRVLVLALAGLTGWATLGEALLCAVVAGSFLDKMRRDRDKVRRDRDRLRRDGSAVGGRS
jgi:hypothetical protein